MLPRPVDWGFSLPAGKYAWPVARESLVGPVAARYSASAGAHVLLPGRSVPRRTTIAAASRMRLGRERSTWAKSQHEDAMALARIPG